MPLKLLHIVSANEDFLLICSCGKPTAHCTEGEKISGVQELSEPDPLIWPAEVRFKNTVSKTETPLSSE